jgi:hypothetical protein
MTKGLSINSASWFSAARGGPGFGGALSRSGGAFQQSVVSYSGLAHGHGAGAHGHGGARGFRASSSGFDVSWFALMRGGAGSGTSFPGGGGFHRRDFGAFGDRGFHRRDFGVAFRDSGFNRDFGGFGHGGHRHAEGHHRHGGHHLRDERRWEGFGSAGGGRGGGDTNVTINIVIDGREAGGPRGEERGARRRESDEPRNEPRESERPEPKREEPRAEEPRREEPKREEPRRGVDSYEGKRPSRGYGRQTNIEDAKSVVAGNAAGLPRYGGTAPTDHGDFIWISQNQAGNNTRYVPGGKDAVTEWNPQGKPVLISPIVLDLPGRGQIETTGASTSRERRDNRVSSTVSFDLDGDGRRERVQWLAPGSGQAFLVDTTKIGANGEIDGSALFGDQGGRYANGYAKLRQKFDPEGVGAVSGAALNRLGAWVDANGNGRLDQGELQSLRSLGITSVSNKVTTERNAAGEPLMRSVATTADGGRIMTEDVWFERASSPRMLLSQDTAE